jgi:50S ribosomal subunit-associated GTPase HflX
MDLKIDVVNKILGEIGRTSEGMIFVFNKIDMADMEMLIDKYSYFNPVFISVKKEEGIEELKKEISKLLL